MRSIKVVARYLDGSIVKGYTQDFLPNNRSFHVRPFGVSTAGNPVEIRMDDLKAVFFVKDFAGDPKYKETKRLPKGEHRIGRMMEVTCRDGEVLVGSTTGYDSSLPGFFLFPADSKENNSRVYILSRAVTRVRFL